MKKREKMEEEKCFRCDKSENQAKLLDAIYGNEIVKICEECSLVEQIPIIRKPTSFQLKESDKPYTVYQRLSRMAGVGFRGQVKQEQPRGLTLDNLRKPKDYLKVMQEKQERAKKYNRPMDLIDNFHWNISMERKKRHMSLTQLGGIIGESETTLKMIEQGFVPDDGNRIIGKIEQYFNINLRKTSAKPISKEQPARILNFDQKSLDSLTIEDLKKMKEETEKNQEHPGENNETMEEKKSRRSFWDIFKRKKKDEEVLTGEDIEIRNEA